MASRDLKDLHPHVRLLALDFIEQCRKENIDVLIYCTYRSNQEQDDLYAQGRTKPGKIVTYARGGQSRHNHTLKDRPASLAFDCVPLRGGKPVWGRTLPEDLKLWQKVGKIGKSVGLKWAGDWTRFKEFPHFESDLP